MQPRLVQSECLCCGTVATVVYWLLVVVACSVSPNFQTLELRHKFDLIMDKDIYSTLADSRPLIALIYKIYAKNTIYKEKKTTIYCWSFIQSTSLWCHTNRRHDNN